MPKPKVEAGTARLKARVPVQVYDQMQRAARLRGVTLTGYLISTAGEDARLSAGGDGAEPVVAVTAACAPTRFELHAAARKSFCAKVRFGDLFDALFGSCR